MTRDEFTKVLRIELKPVRVAIQNLRRAVRLLKASTKRSASAKALATPLYRQRIVRPLKGRGSYRRDKQVMK